MSAAKAPEWHDPDAPRCARDDCGHVAEAHSSGGCVLMYCVCRGFVPDFLPAWTRTSANGAVA